MIVHHVIAMNFLFQLTFFDEDTLSIDSLADLLNGLLGRNNRSFCLYQIHTLAMSS